MNDERRERLNLKTIRVSLESARLGLAKQDRRTTQRGNDLLDQARRAATSPDILAEVEALQDEWNRASPARSEDEGT